jgi:hypothetical protein
MDGGPYVERVGKKSRNCNQKRLRDIKINCFSVPVKKWLPNNPRSYRSIQIAYNKKPKYD